MHDVIGSSITNEVAILLAVDQPIRNRHRRLGIVSTGVGAEFCFRFARVFCGADDPPQEGLRWDCINFPLCHQSGTAHSWLDFTDVEMLISVLILSIIIFAAFPRSDTLGIGRVLCTVYCVLCIVYCVLSTGYGVLGTTRVGSGVGAEYW